MGPAPSRDYTDLPRHASSEEWPAITALAEHHEGTFARPCGVINITAKREWEGMSLWLNEDREGYRHRENGGLGLGIKRG